ncbi:Non-specific serine/threonine protein kinase [Acetobacter pasteurianus]|uniref:Non-specific serine/threonine protein kinase n=2 Tax=Acetobacter pasteurianus TaxID=438 RepID=A0A1A0CM65_ACEPA|nr:Non-specific serine/threonine protein kinase [Acetobacter pasteurianus]
MPLGAVHPITEEIRVEEIFRRMVFNVRALNRDDHVRNHAFLMNAAGEWSLAPAYDVSFSAGPGGEHSIAIAGDGRYPGKGAINEVARVAGIKPVRRDQIVDAVDSALCSWEKVAGNCGVPDFLIEDIGSEMVIARGWK